MIQKFDNIQKLIGNTPLIEIRYKYNKTKRTMFAKLEWFNLSGSIKDRPAFEIIKQAYISKQLKPNQTICETSSGNMGISICAIAKQLGYNVVICMPKFMSEERKQLLIQYGAKLELTENFKQAFVLAQDYKCRGAVLANQFENINNAISHKKTAAEIYIKQPKISCFVSGVGTGGTILGIGKFLKQNTGSKTIAIEPQESPILSTGKSGYHKIQGLSDEIVPKLYNKKLVDKIVQINSNDAICMAQKLCSKLGLGVGISSGANFLGCVLSNLNNCATVFADDNKKYLSTDLSQKISSNLVDGIELISYKVV
ncbi:MAG: PLP-dependent cysteine synthase family protein [Clostridia bacterium]|nr:PLP-dependent cysteine synthase family protein [Clostridia bacterium]